ncbi:MAG: hypothetical protein EP343_22190 [Deltaproteobacteria bacterium]|nr:MAG: hypothetical protein EP343_22190 [Deltaproteobacteria bacterium]
MWNSLMRWAVCGWMAVMLWCVSLDVNAAGFYAPGVGTRAMGQGGALTASGRDLTSHWHNPANLSRLRGLHFQLDGTLLFNAFSFERDPLGSKGFPKVNNIAPPNIIPFLGISYDVLSHAKVPKQHSLVLSFGVWGPNGGNLDYGDASAFPECQGDNKSNLHCGTQGPQRYSLIRSKPFQMFLSFALAYGVKLGPVGLRVGGGFQLVQTRVEQTLAVKALEEATDLESLDTIISIDTTSPLTPSGNFGLTIDLPGGFSIGGAFKLPVPVQANGTLKVDVLPEALGNLVTVSGDAARLELELPWIFRAGVAWQPTFFPRLLVEFAFVYEAWSSLDKIVLSSPEGPNQLKFSILGTESVLEPIDINRKWVDSWSTRVGIQFAILPKYLMIRAGYFYETSAIPQKNFNVSELNGERHGITAGLEGRIPAGPVQIMINAGYMHTFETPLEVKDSEERNIILTPPGSTGSIVGNGKYNAALDLVSLSLSVVWGGYDNSPVKVQQ